MSLVAGIALALYNRLRTGGGRLVDVSLFQAGLWANSMFLSFASAVNSETATRVLRSRNRVGATFRVYRCRDGEALQLLGYQTKRHMPAFLVRSFVRPSL